MDNAENRISIEKINLTPHAGPVPLPNGNEKTPLGSGVITGLLGRGGMAAVYEIWNAQLEMHRAVKIINPGSADSVHQRFQTEIKISAKLKHPNIIEIHGVGEWHGLPFIEMEKIDGTPLDTILTERGALPVVVATSIGIMICRALKYAHTQECVIYGKTYNGVIHRDLKPGNILVGKNGIVKLMDFGIARPVDVSFQTMDGLVSGTLPYLAPEQIDKKKLDVRTDLYALGATLYEIVTGTVAFPQSSFAQLVAYKTRSRFRPLESFSVRLPNRLKRVIYKCMQQDPQKRYVSAAALLKELTAIHGKLTKAAPEDVVAKLMAETRIKKHVLPPRLRFPWFAAAVVCAIGIIGIGIYQFGLPLYRQYTENHQPAQVAFANNPVMVAPSTATAILHDSQSVKIIVPSKPVLHSHETVSKVKQSAMVKSSMPQHANAASPQSDITQYKEKYGTDDLLAIMTKLLGEKNYSAALKVYGAMSADAAKSSQALICKLHALEGSENGAALNAFLQTVPLADAEIYLAKARTAFKNNDIDGCYNLLNKALKSPHEYMEYDALKREVYYYMALCATNRFDASPGEQTYKTALDAWWQLRTALRADPGHPYNNRANEELQRMGKKMQKG